MGDIPPDRCGYTFPEDHRADDFPNHQSCCWRETVGESNSCIWHAGSQEVSKSVEALQETRVPPEIREQNSPHTELLDGANLDDIKLDSEISFKGVALRQANLSEADLEGVKLNDANLSNATLEDANLSNANLSNATLKDANLSKASFSRANLSNTFLMSANLVDSLHFSANLTEAFLYQADLSNARFNRANLADAFLADADLTGADLTDADLRNAYLPLAILRRVDAKDANFNGAYLKDASLTSADCEKTNFENAVLVRASMEKVQLTDANMAGAYLSEVRLAGARIGMRTQLGTEGIVGEVPANERCRYDPNAPPEGPEASLTTTPEKFEEKYGLNDVHPMHPVHFEKGPDPSRLMQLRHAEGTYRRLEELARYNGFATLQSRMFNRRKEMRRHMFREQGEFTRWVFAGLQRWLFAYGESFSRILSVATLAVILFCGLFMTTGTIETTEGVVVTASAIANDPQLVWETLYHSLSVFFTGSGSLTPTGTLGQVLTISLRATGPILLSLLIFVLGRRAAR